MENNVLSAFVVFFVVVACLLIIDDITHNVSGSQIETADIQSNISNSNASDLATLDLETEE